MPLKNPELINELKSINLKWQGKEITEDIYEEMLCVLPPEEWSNGAFLVGEAADTNSHGQELFDCFYQENDKHYYFGRMTNDDFNATF